MGGRACATQVRPQVRDYAELCYGCARTLCGVWPSVATVSRTAREKLGVQVSVGVLVHAREGAVIPFHWDLLRKGNTVIQGEGVWSDSAASLSLSVRLCCEGGRLG